MSLDNLLEIVFTEHVFEHTRSVIVFSIPVEQLLRIIRIETILLFSQLERRGDPVSSDFFLF